MSTRHTITATITESARRLGASKHGNPYYLVTTDAGSWVTETDASIGYAASNYRPGARVVVTLIERSVHTYVVDIDHAV